MQHAIPSTWDAAALYSHAFHSPSGMTAMAQIARPEADKAADAARNARNEIAELGKQITDKAAGQAENVARGGFQSARQAVDAGAEVGQKIAGRAEAGMTEINQDLVELLN